MRRQSPNATALARNLSCLLALCDRSFDEICQALFKAEGEMVEEGIIRRWLLRLRAKGATGGPNFDYARLIHLARLLGVDDTALFNPDLFCHPRAVATGPSADGPVAGLADLLGTGRYGFLSELIARLHAAEFAPRPAPAPAL